MDAHVRQRRASEDTVIDMKISGPGVVGDTDEASVKQRVPDPQVQRVEILENDARSARWAKARAQHRCFRKAVAAIASPQSRGAVVEDDIGILIAGVEIVA